MTESNDFKKRYIRETVESTVPEESFAPEKLEEMIRIREEERAEIQRNISATTPDPDYNPDLEKEYKPVINFKSLGHTGPTKYQNHEVPSKRYETGESLGEGGSGFVFSAYDNSFMREIALKVIRPRNAANEKKVERFINEARISANLEHPGILPVYDIGFTKSGEVFFTMRKVKGTTLGNAIRSAEKGEVPANIALFSDRCDIMIRVCDAIAYAHDRGFIHQDIKPDNILLGEFGEVLIVDWGTASQGDSILGTKKNMFGTPAYMSPEQARRERADARSDVYCLGSTFFHLLTFTFPTWSEDMKTFWEKKRQGIVDPIDADIKRKIPEFLLSISYKAMSSDPQYRYQTVAELRTELKDFQAHIESINLCMTAMQDLETAKQDGLYSSFARAQFGFEQALSAWADNEDAKRGLSLVNKFHGACALENGDIDLAVQILDRDDPRLSDEIQKLDIALMKRKARRKRGAVFRFIGGAALILLCIAGWHMAREYYRHFGRWDVVYEHDFIQNKDTSDLFFSEAAYTVRRKTGDPVRDKGLELSQGRAIWLFSPDQDDPEAGVPGNVRAEATIIWPTFVDGFEIFINARFETQSSFPMHPAGYTCQFGGWAGNISFIGRNPESGHVNPSNGVYVPFKPGVEYTVALQRVDDEISLWVDGTMVYKYLDLLPLSGNEMRNVGFRRWGRGLHIKKIVVRRMSLPEKSTSLIAGDRMYMKGHTESALEEYLRLSEDLPNGAVAEKALAKAYFVAHKSSYPEKELFNDIMERMRTRYPDSKYLVHMLEADIIALWENRYYEKAFALLKEVFERKPETRIMLDLIDRRPERNLSPEDLGVFLSFVGRTTRISRLVLDRWGISDLTPLSDLHLKGLSLYRNQITDLSPLEGMPIENLGLGRNRISDLKPLRGMPLERLYVSENKIESLEGLEHIPLKELRVFNNPVKDLKPLKDLLSLEGLGLGRTDITDLTPLSGLKLQSLSISETRITSLKPLEGMLTLKSLNAAQLSLESLEGLKGTSLEYLRVENCGLESLKHLEELDSLLELNVQKNKIVSLEPLAELKLEKLNISYNKVHDLSPLSSVPLTNLNCGNNLITTLEPLRGSTTLGNLSCGHNKIKSLKPLEDVKLGFLECRANPLENLEPFEDRYPFNIVFDTEFLKSSYVGKIFGKWKTDPKSEKSIRVNLSLQAIRQNDKDLLKDVAIKKGDSGYILIRDWYTWDDARALAEKMGGYLLTIGSSEELEYVSNLITNEYGGVDAWIGLRISRPDFHPEWLSGETYNAELLNPYLRWDGGEVQCYVMTHLSFEIYTDRSSSTKRNLIIEFEE